MYFLLTHFRWETRARRQSSSQAGNVVEAPGTEASRMEWSTCHFEVNTCERHRLRRPAGGCTSKSQVTR